MNYLWGLDLSLSDTGIAIVSLDTYKPILVTSVKTKQNKKLTEHDDHKERIKLITDKYDELSLTYPASVVAIESPFVQHNKSTKALMKVHGVTQRWFYDVPQFYYAPTTIKAAIVHGQAKKEFVEEKLKLAYPDIEYKNNDESDALAIAITYLIKNNLIKWNKTMK